ncbi:MAG: hypothetical protein ACJAUP_001568 [Cellvibrionaceae bacterium]|jgi:hypothetical protein
MYSVNNKSLGASTPVVSSTSSEATTKQEQFLKSDFGRTEITRDMKKNFLQAMMTNIGGEAHSLKKGVKEYIERNESVLEKIPELGGREGIKALKSLTQSSPTLSEDTMKFAPLLFAHVAGREIRVLKSTGKYTYRVSDASRLSLPPGPKEIDIEKPPICLHYLESGCYDVLTPDPKIIDSLSGDTARAQIQPFVDRPEGISVTDANTQLAEQGRQSIAAAKVKDSWAISYELPGKRRVGVPTSQVRQEQLIKEYGQNGVNRTSFNSYGHRAAIPRSLRPAGIATKHKYSTLYLRDSHASMEPLFDAVIKKAKDNGVLPVPPANRVDVKLVGAGQFLDKLTGLYPSLESTYCAEPIRAVRLSSGLQAIIYNYNAQYDEPDKKQVIDRVINQIHHRLGATPSYDSIALYLSSGRQHLQPVVKSKRVNIKSANALDTLLQKIPQYEVKAANFPGDTKRLMALSLSLVKTLKNTIPYYQNSALINDSLRQIENTLEGLCQCTDDFVGTNELFDCLIDEINLLLNTTRPYSSHTVNSLQKEIYCKQVSSIADMTGVSIKSLSTASSGMGALSTVIAESLKQFTGARVDDYSDEIPSYFEVSGLLDIGGLRATGHPVICTALNNSLTMNAATAETIIQRISASLSSYKDKNYPIHVIIDTTLDTHSDKLNRIVSSFPKALENGKLNIILCKSYQKYTSLGSGKIMAGNVSMINNNAAQFCNIERSVVISSAQDDIFLNNNGQLLAHCLRSHDSSIAITQRAIEGAQFINDYCWPDSKMSEGDGHAEGMPFVMRYDNPNHVLAITMETCGTCTRDTFGFLSSSVCTINGQNEDKNFLMRINPGLDSDAQLVERFFGLGHTWGNNYNVHLDRMMAAINQVSASSGRQVLEAIVEKHPRSISALSDEEQEAIAKTHNVSKQEIEIIIKSFNLLRTPSDKTDADHLQFMETYHNNIRASVGMVMYAWNLNDSFKQYADDLVESLSSVDIGDAAPVSRLAKEVTFTARLEGLASNLEADGLSTLVRIAEFVPAQKRLEVLFAKLPDTVFGSSDNSLSAEGRSALLAALTDGVPTRELLGVGKLCLIQKQDINKARAILKIASSRPITEGEVPNFLADSLLKLVGREVNHQRDLDFLRGMIVTHEHYVNTQAPAEPRSDTGDQ